MSKPKFGFTYPTVTGEDEITAFRRVKSEFPDMQIWSHYYDGSDLPQWNEVWFVESGPDVIFLISIKSSDVNAIGARLTTMPADLRGRVFIILHHEPDQWRSESDNRGDPSPSVWKARQVAFANLRNRLECPWRDWIQFWACFTEDRLRTAKAFWMANWGDWVLDMDIFDGIAWDCFNIGRSIVRTGEDMYGRPLGFNRTAELPLIIRENGQVTPVNLPNDSQAVADGVAENWEYAKAEHNVDGVFFGIVWYYNHNNVLVDPSGKRPGRPLTKAVIEGIMDDARTSDEPPFVPDPNHPQYQAGYDAGAASRQPEVDALTAQLAEANAAIPRANDEGMIAAFNETRDWAGARAGEIQADIDNANHPQYIAGAVSRDAEVAALGIRDILLRTARQAGRDEVIEAVEAAMAPYDTTD